MNQKQLILSSQPQQVLKDITVLRYSLAPNQEQQFIEPYHPNQNPIERDMASWKNDCINIMIDSRIDPRGWFKVMQYAADLHNHTANQNNTDWIPPITAQTGDTVDITLLTEFKFNEGILYQDYNSKFPDQGENEKLGK